MSVNLQLTIELDSRGAVTGVRTLDDAIGKLDGTTQTTTRAGKGLMDSMFAQFTAANLATKGISLLIGEVKHSITEYLEATKIQSKLNAMLEITGENLTGAGARIDEFANKMMFLTGIDDEQIKSLEILARQYGMQKEKIDDAVRAAIALTEINGNLETNLKAVDSAYRGNWTQLDRLIPAIREAKTEGEKMAILQQKISEGLVLSTKAMQSSEGQAKALKNQYNNVLESIGEGLLQGLDVLANQLTNNYFRVQEYGREFVAQHELMQMSIERFAKSYTGWKPNKQDIEDEAYATAILADAQRVLNRDVGEEVKVREEEAAAVKKLREEIDAYSKSLGFLTNTAMVDADTKTKRLINSIEDYGTQLKNSKEIQTKVWEEAIKLANDYITAGKQVPAALQAWIDKAHELNDVQIMTEAEAVQFFDIVISGFSGMGDPIAQAINSLGGFKGMIEQSAQQAELFRRIAVGIATQTMPDIYEITGKVTGQTKDAAAATEKWYQGAQDLAAGLGALANIFNLLIPGLGDFVGGIMGGYESILKLNDAIAKGTAGLGDYLSTFGAIYGAAKMLDDALSSVFGNMYENFDAKVKALQAAEQAVIEGQKKVREEYLKTWQGILESFDGIAGATVKTKDLLINLGEAFNTVLSDAKKFGTEGSREMMDMFDAIAASGLQIKEIDDYIAGQLMAGLAGYKAMQAATLESTDAMAAFGDMNIKVFDDMIAYEKKVAENQGLVDGINGATAAMLGLSNAQKLTEEQFDDFGQAAAIAYQKLLDGGMTSTEALKTMAPYLQRLQYLHEQYGYTIDETTQKMIDEGIANGTVMENQQTETQIMISLLGLILEAIGGTIPDNLRKLGATSKSIFENSALQAGQFIDKLNEIGKPRVISIGTGAITSAIGAVGALNGALNNIANVSISGGSGAAESGGIIQAASGFYSPRLSSDTLIQAHRGEPVAIGDPGFNAAAQNGGGNGRTRIYNFYFEGQVTSENVLTILADGISGNKYDIRTKLESLGSN